MDNKPNIVYVMRYIDIEGCVNDIPYKKIGITRIENLDNRVQQISGTKSPIKVQCVFAWSHDNAREIEKALHTLLKDLKSEGEWFKDKHNNLADRMKLIMKLLGTKEEIIKNSNDNLTKSVLKKENEHIESFNQKLLDEITPLLDNKKPNPSKKSPEGPTIHGDIFNFTVHHRKTVPNTLYISKSKERFKPLIAFLKEKGFECGQSGDDTLSITRLSIQEIANIINFEAEFSARPQEV